MKTTTEYFINGMKREEQILSGVFLEMGAPDHLLGYPMTVEAVMIVLEEGLHKANLHGYIYREIAEAFDSTPTRTDRAIRHFIERIWATADLDVLDHYFRNTIEKNKAKPTNKQFIYRLANIVRFRLRDCSQEMAV